MMRALFSGVAGLKTHQTKMDVIGNNIANVNTVGFKSTSVVFQDLLYQRQSGASGPNSNIGGINAKQIGLGASMASTNISITSGGANQTTGGAFDLKLNDGSTTNFFIVNDGTTNYFTRSGAFKVDAAGNLVMSSNGYYVMGWQVGPDGYIKKDTVSKLQINGPDTQSSAPEATTEGYVSGVLDKNDKDVQSDDGYAMNLNFYDSLGYAYTAKFAAKVIDADKGTYTVELKNIYDSTGNDILQEYIAQYKADNAGATDNDAIKSLYGNEINIPQSYSPSNKSISINASDNLVYTVSGTPYESTGYNQATGMIEFGAAGSLSVAEVYGISVERATSANANIVAGKLVFSETRVGNVMRFDLENENGKGNGALWYVDDADGLDVNNLANSGKLALTLNASKLTDYIASPLTPENKKRQFRDIDIDFSTVLNYDNQGTSSMGLTRGNLDGIHGLGKPLGALIGLSVDGSGYIYGSYDNGNTELLGQIPVAQFANPSGLESVGSSLFQKTLNSGDFDGIGVDVSSDGGSITTGTLEMSNVDLSTEFTDLITTQRGFQANSRIITTSDTLLEELINLKR